MCLKLLFWSCLFPHWSFFKLCFRRWRKAQRKEQEMEADTEISSYHPVWRHQEQDSWVLNYFTTVRQFILHHLDSALMWFLVVGLAHHLDLLKPLFFPVWAMQIPQSCEKVLCAVLLIMHNYWCVRDKFWSTNVRPLHHVDSHIFSVNETIDTDCKSKNKVQKAKPCLPNHIPVCSADWLKIHFLSPLSLQVW